MKVQLLYFPECPNVELARKRLHRALQSVDVEIQVDEIDTNAPQAPEELRSWGSPTILVDGIDVGGEHSGGGPCCRLYAQGALTEEMILAALRRA